MSSIFSVPRRALPIIRIFVSSTFSDLVAERNALAKHVWPALEDLCRQRGFTFQAIDLRWGVPGEAGLAHRTMQICLEELHRAQETSPEPNFLILLGNKYGWRPLPETISETEFNCLRDHTDSEAERKTLGVWYRRDGNARPDVQYVLRARTDSPDGQDYTNPEGSDGKRRDTQAWLDVQETLWQIVNRAYPGKNLVDRFRGGTKKLPPIATFQSSATEQEIWHGALQVENARDHVVAWFRGIDRTGGDPQPSQLRSYVDLLQDESPDADAAALDQLKIEVQQKLEPEPITTANCHWAKGPNGELTGEVTTDHLAPMCEDILTRVRAIILRQINAYWAADLSAEDATVTLMRGSQRELDLELRDHGRFAEERGPVTRFVGRETEVQDIREYLRSTTNRPFIVYGPSGSGKTALLAYVAQQPFLPGTAPAGVSPLILTRFLGMHPESSTVLGLLTSLCRELRVHLPVTAIEKQPDGGEVEVSAALPDAPHKLLEEFYSQLAHATPQRPIYIFLDALDQLDAADSAREVDWIRSPLLRQTDLAVHARIVASCLSPSPEFPPDSEPCRPYLKLMSRELLAGVELGALEAADAQLLLRDWLTAAHRGLTDDQWKAVIPAIEESSSRRQPLYLKVLVDQLARCREFDQATEFPRDLSHLLEQSLRRLSEPSQHDVLPRIALGYLVSARYGLSEGELLEVLYCDEEIQKQLNDSRQAYGHELPEEPQRYPIAPWARLRSELRPYLSERAAPGTTVMSCYHRQVEQAIQTLFLADEAVRTNRLRRLAKYFDGRWDRPDAHALMELPDLMLALHDHQGLYDRLTNFAFPMRKAEVGLLESISTDHSRLREQGPPEIRERLTVWQDFLRELVHILRRGLEEGSAHKILLQLALEHADDSQVTQAAEQWLCEDRCNWLRLQRINRLPKLRPNPCTAVLEGHTSWVFGAMMLTDSQILSWSVDKTLRVWDAATGACTAVLEGHGYDVTGAISLPDGRILSWSVDMTLRLWEAATGACTTVLKGHGSWIIGAMSLSNNQILSWSKDTTLRVWDGTTGDCTAVLEGHTSWIDGALLLSDGRIISQSNGTKLRVWDVATGANTAVLVGHTSNVNGALLLSEDRILSWSSDKTLRIWEATTGDCTAVLQGHTDGVSGAQLLSDGRILSWSGDGALRMWDAATGACDALLEGHSRWIIGTLLLSDNRILSWSAGDNTLRVWDSATETCTAVLAGHRSWIDGALLLSDDRILSWSSDKTLRVWEATTGACTAVLEGHTSPVVSALLLSDGRILSWSNDDTLRVWEATTGACTAVLEGHTIGVAGALPLYDDQILSWSRDKTLCVWDAVTGACTAVLERHTFDVKGALSLSADRILSWESYSSWGSDHRLRVWDATTGACTAFLEGHTHEVTGALLLPDGRILSWSDDHSLRVWDAASGTCLEEIRESEFPVRHPDWFYHRQTDTQPQSVAENWSAEARSRTVRLFHRLGLTPLPMWQAETDSETRLLRPDGTLVVGQANGQVCFLKLYHGRKRVTLAEAEKLISPPGLSTS